MSYQEEPDYRRFEGTCRDCGVEVVYYNGVKRHSDHIRCASCEKAWITERLTGQETINCPVAGQG